MKYYIQEALYYGLVLLAVSFFFSLSRLGYRYSHNQKAPCVQLFIDKLEPVVSTRWFCPVQR